MKSRKIFFVILTLVILAFSYFAVSAEFLISDSYTVLEGSSVNSSLPFGFFADESLSLSAASNAAAKNLTQAKESRVTLKLFNIVPVKEVSVNIIESPLVYPSGQCLGIKMYAKGIIVTGFSDFQTKDGVCVSPGAVAGLKTGDIIEKINGKTANKISEFTSAIDSGGDSCTLIVNRNGKKLKFLIKPKLSLDGHMRMGVFVKNSIAGVGTMTYTTGENGSFAALGHGISDSGVVVPLKNADVYQAEIIDIKKGKRGSPGEIIAAINESKLIGSCTKNTSGGIYGTLSNYTPKAQAVYAASNTEIEKGKATILCQIDDSHTPKEYGVEILSVNIFRKNKSKSFTIKVTDDELLQKTGGIVQGMSGSPVIQNGKLVGAVTHVFVNDPTRGYGIFIENMLAEAEKIK